MMMWAAFGQELIGAGNIMISVFARGSAFWAIAAAGLLWLVVHQIADDRPTLSDVIAAPVEASGKNVAAEPQPIIVLPSEDLVGEIVERPLFSATRRPPSPTTLERPEPDTASDETLALELIGTILVGDVHIALLQHPTEGLLRRRPGESIGGWTLVNVEKHRVSLESENEFEILTLRKDRIRPPKPRSPSQPGPTPTTKSQPKEPAKENAPAAAPIRRPI